MAYSNSKGSEETVRSASAQSDHSLCYSHTSCIQPEESLDIRGSTDTQKVLNLSWSQICTTTPFA